MSALAVSPTTLAAIVISLSFAAGLNVYLTVFSLGVMARLHWIMLPDGLHSVANPWIMVASGVLFAISFFADKIPGFDVIWNALHTFIRIPLAALLAYGVGNHLPPEMHVLVTCLGALIATIAHSSKTAARVLVTPSPEPISNIALSTGEDAAALGLTWLVMHHPLATGSAVAFLTVVCAGGLWFGLRAIRRAWRSFMSNRRRSEVVA